jgi:hypothetical protein
MSKRYNEQIQVWQDETRHPVAFVWRGRKYQIKSIDHWWTVQSEWWHVPNSTKHHAVVLARGQAVNEGAYEIYLEMPQKKWYLAKVFD